LTDNSQLPEPSPDFVELMEAVNDDFVPDFSPDQYIYSLELK